MGTGSTLDVAAAGLAPGDAGSLLHNPEYDGIDNGTGDLSAPVMIENAVPTINNLTILPDPPTVTDTLECSYTAGDTDGTPLDIQTVWTDGNGDVIGPFEMLATAMYGVTQTEGAQACGIDGNHNLHCWGNLAGFGTDSAGNPYLEYLDLPDDIVHVSVNGQRVCVTLDTGAVRCWGWGSVANPGHGLCDPNENASSLPGHCDGFLRSL